MQMARTIPTSEGRRADGLGADGARPGARTRPRRIERFMGVSPAGGRLQRPGETDQPIGTPWNAGDGTPDRLYGSVGMASCSCGVAGPHCGCGDTPELSLPAAFVKPIPAPSSHCNIAGCQRA
ncbi:hypothetical protein STHU_37580 [Allostella humosa]|nr:hypothetical protein STHU_37580 [Stella humosa]